METFTLATVSLIIAVSLFVKKKNDPVQLSFAALCIAVFIQKGRSFFHAIFNSDFWKIIDYAGLLIIPPITVISESETASTSISTAPSKNLSIKIGRSSEISLASFINSSREASS